MDKYDFRKIEQKWQKHWEKNKIFEVNEKLAKGGSASGGKKFYSLIEFPFLSGEGLHVGHPRPFTAMDVISRKRRMEDHNVLYPIGFDAFGLPTENFAIKTGRPPAEIAKENIVNFTRQLKALGFSFDWSRQVNTSDPAYYKWTQWMFLKFFEAGLAYKTNMPINWCPSDKIGLANEEVVNGNCERCGHPVEKRDKEQWMLAITKYADKLLAGLKDVDYIERARVQQENWIGRSEGAELDFALNVPGQDKGKHKVTVFTTRPDTLFGTTFVAVSAEVAKGWLDVGWDPGEEVKEYVEEILIEHKTSREDFEKTGIATNVTAVNPVNNSEVPVWVTNYVLADVGTGAIMAVPGHDERDFEFAKKYDLPIKEVVLKKFGKRQAAAVKRDGVLGVVVNKNKVLVLKHLKTGIYRLPGGGFDKGESEKDVVARELQEETGYNDFEILQSLGKIEANYDAVPKGELRHRVASGYLIKLNSNKKGEMSEEDKGRFEEKWLTYKEAMGNFGKNGESLGEEEFVARAFEEKNNCFVGDGISVNSDFLDGLETKEAKQKMIKWLNKEKIGKAKVNYKLRDWVFSRQRYWGEPIPLVYCEKCDGWIPVPYDQLPVELPKVKKYEPTDTGESPLSQIEDWVNTECPNCGGPARRETDIMPNWAGSSWYFLRYTDPKNDKEFASMQKMRYWLGSSKPGEGGVDWYNGGMEHTVLHLLYSRFWNQFLYDQKLIPHKEPYKKRTSHGMILGEDGEKMSKSKGNVVNPDDMVERFGADAFRAYIMFMGPFDQAVQWDTNGLVGVKRFLDRVWSLRNRVIASESDEVGGVSQSQRGSNEITTSPSAPRNDVITTLLHQTIKKVTEDIEAMRFNTALSALMQFNNELVKSKSVSKDAYQNFIKMLSPFAPHIAEELWSEFGDKNELTFAAWPTYDEKLIVEETITLAIQVNGKVRDELEVAVDISESKAKDKALESEKVQKWLSGKKPKKVIYVKGKLVSIVV